jgi:hypothetical protein
VSPGAGPKSRFKLFEQGSNIAIAHHAAAAQQGVSHLDREAVPKRCMDLEGRPFPGAGEAVGIDRSCLAGRTPRHKGAYEPESFVYKLSWYLINRRN